jgi:predicted  nucleic acid-binding Zn-ribbon protein
MNSEIEKLLALQEIDLRIRALNTRLMTIPIEIKKISDEIQNQKNKLASQKESSLAGELELKRHEAASKEKEENIRRLQSQSAMVKKNDEYRALMNEIAAFNKMISEIETNILLTMEKNQENKAKFKDAEEQLKKGENHAAEEINDLRQTESKIKTEIEKENTKRSQYIAPVSKENLQIYEKLLAKGTGTPVAAVKDGICLNCHLRLTPYSHNQVKKSIFIRCENCACIIYIAN